MKISPTPPPLRAPPPDLSKPPPERASPADISPPQTRGGIRSRNVIASRIFAGPNQYPPKEFAAYGIVAFPSRPSLHDRDRYLTICHAYLASLPHAFELELPPAEQMVTVWPLDSDHYTWLNDPTLTSSLNATSQDVCAMVVHHYGLATARTALKDAAHAGVNINTIGPLLLAWSPSADKGKDDALVLVSNLSDITTYDQALEMFLAWSREIERDPAVWSNG